MLIYLDCDDDADDASIKKDQRHFLYVPVYYAMLVDIL